ncbi:putative DNA-binding transcriptional regulator YafY [Friedmanniella endophytica]|uniref:Putative DNA-binding transcriptional regulator YafY n=1 Tax=Microlunatus kandeliicorticis TaxID=1759536 RepID=A0A7W3IT41_9ACTN|nr:WYL domain-containing protein [Microlunatus kandeliicorticis]MBA8794718.1 putative DNA-binding transcriptional regulator YafY [Microlunatus kandeliicorticis]
MRADRLLQITTLLRVHGRMTATELAERLEVTPRTVLRDMEALSAAGVPLYAERGRHGGFALLPGYRPATEDLTAVEIQALLLSNTGAIGGIGLDAPLRTALRKVSTRLAPDLVDAAERAAERILVDQAGWFGRGDDAMPCFDTVRRAALGDHRLRLGYRPRNATRASTRTVDPYGLLQAGRSWYLIAAHRGRPHTYRVDRIERAEPLYEPSARPADLDLVAVWERLRGEWSRPPELTVRVEVTDGRPNEALIMLGSVGSSVPRITPGPPMIMELEVLSVRTAVAALAGLGTRVRVLDPPELIIRLHTTLTETAALYA